MVEARDVGHDCLLVRTGSAHNVCGEERTSGRGWRLGLSGRRLRLLNTEQLNEETGNKTHHINNI